MATTDSHPFEEAFGDLFCILNGLPFPYCLMGALALGAFFFLGSAVGGCVPFLQLINDKKII